MAGSGCNVVPAYSRAVLGRAVIIAIEIGWIGGRDGSIGQYIRAAVVGNWYWPRRGLMRLRLGEYSAGRTARRRARGRPGAAEEVWRVLPTLVRKLRHGPLCDTEPATEDENDEGVCGGRGGDEV